MPKKSRAYDKPVRVYELARDFEVPNKDLITWLQGQGYEVTTHSNTLSSEEATKASESWTQKDEASPAGDAEVVKSATPAPSASATPKASPKSSKPNTDPGSRPDRRAEEKQSGSDSGDRRVAYSSRSESHYTTRTYHSDTGPQRGSRFEGRSAGQSARRTSRGRPSDGRARRPGERTGGAGPRTRGQGPAPAPPPEDASAARSQTRRLERKDRDRAREEIRELAEDSREETASTGQTVARSTDEIALPERDELVEVMEGSTVAEVARALGIRPNAMIANMFKLGLMATINQPMDLTVLNRIEDTFHFVATKRPTVEDKVLQLIDIGDDDGPKEPRAAVVTIMGHVDHGKTTLLDAVRKTNVVDHEAGQITQHIGAYNVNLPNGRVVFLDTPGHEAFTAMRARGAQATDVVVLVVAADDGVMPQTVEAINHAKAAEVPIVVAVNKIDLPNANVDRVKDELSRHGLISEDWGGDTVFCEVSAKTGAGLDNLLEYLNLESELLELTANSERPALGIVVEAKVDTGRGPVATVLVQNGTLRVGDHFVAGFVEGRVRALVDDVGGRLQEAGPSVPVEVLGFSEVCSAGDRFYVLSEHDARAVAEERSAQRRQERMALRPRVTLDELHQQIQEGTVKELNTIIRADVEGSIDALRSSLSQFDTEEVRVAVVHAGVGGITETDVMLAAASSAVVIGFNVRPTPEAERAAEREGVDLRFYNVIYGVANDIRAALEGLLEPELNEQVLGRANVREVFRVPRFGNAAGCHVNNGRIVRGMNMRVLRDNRVVHEGTVDSIRRFKEDAREVAAGYECGIAMSNFGDFKIEDVLECFTHEKVARRLTPSTSN